MADTFEVISSGLLDSLVRCDGSISGGSCQVLSILVWDVYSLVILVTLSQTKIDNVHIVPGVISASDEEVIRLDISMDQSLLMDFLDALYQLDGNQKYGLEVELALTGLEQIF